MISDLLIGTYTRGTQAEGIYRCRWNARAECFEAFDLAVNADNPSFLVAARDRVFSVNEVADYLGDVQGALSEYRRDGDTLLLRDQRPTLGADPCHLAFDAGRLAVANYNGANVVVYEAGQGELALRWELTLTRTGSHPRQTAPHPHGVYFRGLQLWVPDLGADAVYRFRVDSGESLPAVDLAPGSGPRHLAFSTDPEAVFIIHELDNSISRLDQDGIRQRISTLPAGAGSSSTAEIDVVGHYLIGSNRGHDSLVSFAIDPGTGELAHPRFHGCGGAHPRHFTVTADKRWLLVANRDSNNLCALPLDTDGRPGAVVASLECPAPVCVLTL